MPNETILNDYKIIKTIGQGAFSKVKLAIHLETGLKVAIKVVDKKMMADRWAKSRKKKSPTSATSPTDIDNISPVSPVITSIPTKLPELPKGVMSTLNEEVQLMMRLDHPNIIKVYQVIDSELECHIVMYCWLTREYAKGGDMVDRLKSRLSEQEARRYFRQLVSAIDHAHSANVVHRDLKLDNLLLDENNDLLVTDFGLGRIVTTEYMQTFCGTPNYAPIELISGVPYNGILAEIWSLGVCLFFFVAGRFPFTGVTVATLYRNIQEVNYRVPEHFSPELVDLIRRIFVKDPNKRIDIQGIRQHPWVCATLEPPLRVPPRVGDTSSMITTIYYESKFTIITLGKPFHVVKPIKSEASLVQSRRKSLSVTPITTDLKHIEKHRCHSAKPVSMRRMSIVRPDVDVQEEPDLNAIQEWHRIHRPPKFIRPAQLQHGTAMNCTALDPSTMFQDLHNALIKIQDQHKVHYTRQPDFYVFQCTIGPLAFEAEICKNWLSGHSLQIRRLKGDMDQLKDIERIIVSDLDWS